MVEKTMFVVVILTCVLATSVTGHEYYRKYIPNGYNVPNACTDDADDIWHRVGHEYEDAGHGNARLQFGKDFHAAKHSAEDIAGIWPILCELDSDKDGRTNGRELGDQGCTWSYGQESPTPPNGEIVTHPGIPDTESGAVTDETYCH